MSPCRVMWVLFLRLDLFRPIAIFCSIAIVIIRRRCAASGTRRQYVALAIHGSSALEEFPVRGAGGQVEGPGIYEDFAFVDLGEEKSIFRKANVIANPNTNPSQTFHIEKGNSTSSTQCLTLLETNSARNVNIEQMNLAMLHDNFAAWIDHETGIINLSRTRLRHRPPHNVHASRFGHFHQHHGRRTPSPLRRSVLVCQHISNPRQYLGIISKSRSCIRTVPNFG
mmetsp:Transcript_22356/g.46483  ORF Transcript_22356/g.46483 Transcript_22356/m.46483 type:complete len:225 (-) Transcript_22356:701-1375(-)